MGEVYCNTLLLVPLYKPSLLLITDTLFVRLKLYGKCFLATYFVNILCIKFPFLVQKRNYSLNLKNPNWRGHCINFARVPPSAPKRVGGTAVASQLYRTSSFSSGRSSAPDQDDMYSDASLEDDVLDLNHKVRWHHDCCDLGRALFCLWWL